MAEDRWLELARMEHRARCDWVHEQAVVRAEEYRQRLGHPPRHQWFHRLMLRMPEHEHDPVIHGPLLDLEEAMAALREAVGLERRGTTWLSERIAAGKGPPYLRRGRGSRLFFPETLLLTWMWTYLQHYRRYVGQLKPELVRRGRLDLSSFLAGRAANTQPWHRQPANTDQPPEPLPPFDEARFQERLRRRRGQEVERFRAAQLEALRSLDPAHVLAFFDRWQPVAGPMDVARAEVVMHRARTVHHKLTTAERRLSVDWLRRHGHKGYLGAPLPSPDELHAPRARSPGTDTVSAGGEPHAVQDAQAGEVHGDDRPRSGRRQAQRRAPEGGPRIQPEG